MGKKQESMVMKRQLQALVEILDGLEERDDEPESDKSSDNKPDFRDDIFL